MSYKWHARLAVLLTVFGTLLYLLAILFAYLGRNALLPPGWGPWYGSLITTLPIIFGLYLGCILILKLPHNPYGWVWITLGFAFGCALPFCQNYAILALMVIPDQLPLGWAAGWIGGLSWYIGVCMYPLVLLLFPNGRPPTRRWRILLWIVLAALVVGVCTGWVAAPAGIVPLEFPNRPSGAWVEWLNSVAGIAIGVIFLSIPMSAISLLLRYRSAGQSERQQLKWFAYGSVFFVLLLGSDFLYTAPGFWEPLKEALFFAALPLTIGIAILRYRLWDIDVVIRRTLLYGVLTATLAVVYFGLVTILQSLFSSLTRQQSTAAIVLSTLAIAALFAPLRRRLQDFIDRSFYRKKYDAEKTLDAFAVIARSETDLETLSEELVRVVQETMQPEQVSLWLRNH